MRRKIAVAVLTAVMATSMAVAQAASAQGGCKAFGEDTSGFARLLGREFGEATAANPDVRGFVRGLHVDQCGQ